MSKYKLVFSNVGNSYMHRGDHRVYIPTYLIYKKGWFFYSPLSFSEFNLEDGLNTIKLLEDNDDRLRIENKNS